MLMRLSAATLTVVCLISGCDSSTAPSPVVVLGPHHGTTIRLADDKGFVELTNEPEVKDRRSKEPTSIVAYYLQTDTKSPLDPPPTDVNFVIQGTPKNGSQTVPMAAETKADDPAGPARFASKPGPYPLSAIRGTLNAKLGGQEISTSFAGDR
jgi:hypothetical protein